MSIAGLAIVKNMKPDTNMDLRKIRSALTPLLNESGFVLLKSAFVSEVAGRRTTLTIRKVSPTNEECTIRWEMKIEFGDETFYPQFIHNQNNMPIIVIVGVTTLVEVVDMLASSFKKRVVPFLENAQTAEAIVALGRISLKHMVGL